MSQKATLLERPVVFQAPIFETISPPPSDGKGVDWNHQKIAECIRWCEENGFGPNAIVTTRNQAEYEARQPKNWGFIKEICRYKQYKQEFYFPLEVVWFTEDEVTLEWPEDLFLIHKAMDLNELFDKIKKQQ